MIAVLLFILFIFLLLLMLLGWLLPAFIVGFIIWTIWRKVAKDRRLAKEDREESLQEGGVEEPRLLRELTVAEAGELSKLSKNFHWHKNLAWGLVPIFLIIDLFLILALPPIFKEAIEKDPVASLSLEKALLIFFGPLIIPVQLWLIQISLKARPSYLDLRSPVFGVQGKVVKATDGKKGNQPMYYYLTIRGVRFTSQFNNDLVRHFFDSFQEGDEVAVEYSPRTKHVWKIYKTEDI